MPAAGLARASGRVANNVGIIQAAVDDLSAGHVKLSGKEAADVKAKWGEVSGRLYHTRENLQVLAAVYGLDPTEMAAWKVVFADKLTELGSPSKEKDKQKKDEKAAPSHREGKEAPPPTTPEVTPCPPRTNRCGSATPTCISRHPVLSGHARGACAATWANCRRSRC